MRRILKWIAIALGVVVVLLIIAAGGLYAAGTSSLTRTYDIEAEAITIPTDEAALARGAYLAATVCSECHESNFAGSTPDNIFVDEPGIITLYAANLTPGKGGIGDFTDADLVRAIRHGLDRDGTPLIVMPAEIFSRWSAEDIGSVIAFLRTLAAGGQRSARTSGWRPRAHPVSAGADGSDHARRIHRPQSPVPRHAGDRRNRSLWSYLVSALGCTLCHGDNLAGGLEPPQVPPGSSPLSANLTGDHLAGWTADDFVNLLRTGVDPDGHEIDSMVMPIGIYGRMSDDDLQALWLYIQSLPPAETAAQ